MEVRLVQCKSALSPSRLPGLDWALNPYRGCGHGCSYCYAQDVTRFEMGRPWGDVVEVKINIVSRLRRELEKGASGAYGIGTVTDPYQPLEKEYELTRGCLKLLRRANARVSILTKSSLVLRDLDVLKGWPGAEVGVSIGCCDEVVASKIEPGAAPVSERFRALSSLAGDGIDVYLMAAPILPGICDSERSLTELVGMAADSGVRRIMWDKYNPKPMAGARMRRAAASCGLELAPAHDEASVQKIRSVLERECSIRGIELLNAF